MPLICYFTSLEFLFKGQILNQTRLGVSELILFTHDTQGIHTVYGEKSIILCCPGSQSDEAEVQQITVSKGKKGSWAAALAGDRHAVLLGVTRCGSAPSVGPRSLN